MAITFMNKKCSEQRTAAKRSIKQRDGQRQGADGIFYKISDRLENRGWQRPLLKMDVCRYR
jgi:hypothetical protein